MKHRVHLTGAREAIGHAMEIVAPFADRIGPVEFVVGVDPGFIGLHSFGRNDDTGVAYSDAAHCCWPFHLDGPADRRVTTIVIPKRRSLHPATVVHELGHALHHRVGFDFVAEPITDYAGLNHYEAFAEAFVGWHYWHGDQDRLMRDRRTVALFEGLAAQ